MLYNRSLLFIYFIYSDVYLLHFPGGSSGKESPANAKDIRDAGLIPGSGWSPGGGHDSPLQCSRLGNPRDRGAWRAAVPGVTKG